MIPEFLNRSEPIIKNSGYGLLSNTKISIAGLGGVGGKTFLNLVRSGIENFKIADNGIFDIPDINRQELALTSNINQTKIDYYENFAKDINPNIKIEKYNDGITVSNIDNFIKDSDIFIKVIDFEQSQDIKTKTIHCLNKYNIPMFQALTTGYSGLCFNYKPGGILPKDFWKLMYKHKTYIDKFLFNDETFQRIKKYDPKYKFPSTCIGANTASLLLSSEIITYILKDELIINRKVIFLPKIIIFNSIDLNYVIKDLTKI
jgi:molybdopterin/thiamine biosynthesis adenylyltransferase